MLFTVYEINKLFLNSRIKSPLIESIIVHRVDSKDNKENKGSSGIEGIRFDRIQLAARIWEMDTRIVGEANVARDVDRRERRTPASQHRK